MLLTEKLSTEEFAEKTWKTPLWLIKWIRYEFWPLWLFYLPLIPVLIWLMIRSRSWKFYIYTNPGIENGGFSGESKIRILNTITDRFKPWSQVFGKGSSMESILNKLMERNISFPVIAKPDIGEQGKGVEKIHSAEELEKYICSTQYDFIIQEFVEAPVELGVFYIRYPDHLRGKVSSVTSKKFLSVNGDGVSSIKELMMMDHRSAMQVERLQQKNIIDLHTVPAKGEVVLLEPAGNHCLGTTFLNANHLISERLNHVFDNISSTIPGFYYGRFDLRVTSINDLINGDNIKILELNGAGSIPGHIFDPSGKLLHAYRDVIHHWKAASDIAIINRKKKVVPVN